MWVKVTYGEAQVVQPANVMFQVIHFHVADGIPDTRQPVGDKSKDAHEQHQDSSAVLRVAVELPRDSHKPQETGSF